MAMKESTINIIKYLQEHADDDLTAADVAEALGVDKRSVDGAFTQVIRKKGLGDREVAEVKTADGLHAQVKFLRLTAEGRKFDCEAPTEA